MRYDRNFIVAAVVCLLLGESFGVWMGANEDFTLAPAHAHLNLLGWVTLCLYGLVHRAYPALKASRLAPVQMAAAIIGALAAPIGIVMSITGAGPAVALADAALLVVSTLMFGWMFITRAGASA
jgi:hypothetical protein